jgi:hypothetical protein
MYPLKYLLAIPTLAVPDGGATMMLLGGALCGLVLLRRYLKR